MTYVTYKIIRDEEELKEFLLFLDENAIPYELEDTDPDFKPTFLPNDKKTVFRVKIHPDDFQKTRVLEKETLLPLIEQIDASYYLFSFSNDELIDVIKTADKWSLFDVVLAEKLAKERKLILDENLINSLKDDRLDELSLPEKEPTFWIAMGYFFSIFIGLVGLIIGVFYATHKKTLPNGQTIFAYSEPTRFHGKVISLISSINLILITISFLFFTNK